MSKITPCLWFSGEAEEAANPGGTVLVVEFTLAG